MNINLTLFLQMISFAVFVWFSMKLRLAADRGCPGSSARPRSPRAWPPPNAVTRSRISVNSVPRRLMVEAKEQAADIVAQAQKRATEIVEEAKGDARAEGERLITAAKAEIEQETNRAREALRGQGRRIGDDRRRRRYWIRKSTPAPTRPWWNPSQGRSRTRPWPETSQP